jgi:antitoxin (DNA-binding transcriptional repressor) of toxin-antitoxin stability system
MTIQVNIAKAKGILSDLVARAEAGEKVVLARNGQPVIEFTPVAPTTGRRRLLGIWDHLGPLQNPDLFLEPDEETLAWVDKPITPTE